MQSLLKKYLRVSENKIKDLSMVNLVHKLRAVTFYTSKQSARKESKRIAEKVAISTYCNPLPIISKTITELSNCNAIFYNTLEILCMYLQEKRSKWSDTFLHNLLSDILDKKGFLKYKYIFVVHVQIKTKTMQCFAPSLPHVYHWDINFFNCQIIFLKRPLIYGMSKEL